MKKSSIFPLIRYESTIALFKVLNYFASDKKVNSKIQIKIPWFQSLWYHKVQHLHLNSPLSLSLCENVLVISIYPPPLNMSQSVLTLTCITYTISIQQDMGFKQNILSFFKQL